MSKRKWAPGSFVPCSPKHHHCSPAHAALVAGYRLARHDEEIRHEATLTNPGDLKLAKENGFKLITFKDWLIAHKGEQDRWTGNLKPTKPGAKSWVTTGCTISEELTKVPGS